jgi:GxxExxY protein
VIELRKIGLHVEQQISIPVLYDGVLIGDYAADIVVDSTVIIELKAVKQLLAEHEAQLLNYLKATLIEVGLLMNFGPKAQYVRKVYDNSRKGQMNWISDKGQ